MNENLPRATDEQSEQWVKNDAKLLELGQAKHSDGRLVVTDSTVLEAIHKEMMRDKQSSQEEKERLTIDEQIVETFTQVFGDKVEAYEQQMWDVTRRMVEEGRFADDHPRPVDLSHYDAIVQMKLNGTEVKDDLYARFIILPTNGQSMLVYSIRNANDVMGRVSRGARVYGEEDRLKVKARIGYLYPKDDDGSANMTAKLDELKGTQRGREYFEVASEEQKEAILRYLQQLQRGHPDFNVDSGEYWSPKHSETEAVLA